MVSLKNQKMFGLVLLAVLSLAGAASASNILFSEDFSSGTLDNWSKTGRSSWIQDVSGDDYAVVPADGSSSYAAIERPIDTSSVSSTDSWEVSYDLGWWDNHDPQILHMSFGNCSLSIRQGEYSYKWALSVNGTMVDEAGDVDEPGSRSTPTFIARKLAWDAETQLLTGSVWDSGAGDWVVKVSVTGDYGLNAAATTLKFEDYDTVNWAGASLDNIAVSVVPEPTTMTLLGLGGLVTLIRRRK